MNFSRAWMVLTLVWAAISLLLAPMFADAIWDDDFASTAFSWLLLVAGALIPLAHQFVHPQRPYRRVILIGAVAAAALFAYALSDGRRTGDLFWIPLAWAGVLGLSDWLFIKAQPTARARQLNADAEVLSRSSSTSNIDHVVESFDDNAKEFKKVFLDKYSELGSDIQFGSVSLSAMRDFMATKFGLEAALAAFYIVFQRVHDDPRKSEAHAQLRRHISKKISKVSLPDLEKQEPYLTDAEIQRVWNLVIDPKYSSKKDEVRLAVAMTGLFIDSPLRPPLTDDEDRETLLLLMKRTLNRMRICAGR